jgi:hypothetical protein
VHIVDHPGLGNSLKINDGDVAFNVVDEVQTVGFAVLSDISNAVGNRLADGADIDLLSVKKKFLH